MSTSHNITAIDSSRGNGTAPSKPGVFPMLPEGTKPFADVLDALTLSFEGTPKDPPMTTQESTSTKSNNPKGQTHSTVQNVAQKPDTPPKKIESLPASLLPESSAYTNEDPHLVPPQQPIEMENVEEPTAEPLMNTQTVHAVEDTTTLTPAHMEAIASQQIAHTAAIPQRQKEDSTAKLETANLTPAHVTPHNIAIQPEQPESLPQDLIKLIRGKLPVATVEVQYPENNIPRIQLPLSVMNHVVPNQPQLQAAALGLMPISSPSTDAHSEGGSLASSKDERGQLQGGLSSSKANATAQGKAKTQAAPHDKAMMQEMVDRIRNLLKEQRQDMKVIVQHAEYGQVTMNLRFTQQNKNVQATFLSDNEGLLELLQSSSSDINQVFHNAGIKCQQQHVRRV